MSGPARRAKPDQNLNLLPRILAALIAAGGISFIVLLLGAAA
jgi:hypothetical protein